MTIRTLVHRDNPFVASRSADAVGRASVRQNPERVRYFAEREVLRRDGGFPFGEGYLYDDISVGPRAANWSHGVGKPGASSTAGHRGTKPEQQDAYGAWHFRAGGHDAALIIAADGVSASGSLAAPASKRATEVFAATLQDLMRDAPRDEEARHAFVESALTKAAFAANFEVLRQVLFDEHGDGAYDEGDAEAMRRRGVDLPTGPLTPTQMQIAASKLRPVVAMMDARDRSALTTFAAALVIDNDVYTFSAGDAVIGLFRPSEPEGQRLIQLTHRDQQVVDIYRNGEDFRRYPHVYENVITGFFGGAEVTGTIRRYRDLLEPGDRLVAHTDGLSPRREGRGIDRAKMEAVLQSTPIESAADALVKGQLRDHDGREYQDNIGVAVLGVR